MPKSNHVSSGADTSHAADQRPQSSAGSPPVPTEDLKRTLNANNAFETVANVMASGSVLVQAAVKPKIPAALREKIFLAVTSVNDCRYCKWGHTHWALARGVPLEEVNEILGLQVKSLEAKNDAEAAVLLFAQHYAENLDKFDPESIENLRSFYSEAEVAEILAYIRFITLTNLTGNTVDVFLDRLGNGLFEGMVVAAAAPVAFVLSRMARSDRQVGMDPIRSDRHVTLQDTPPKPDTERSQ
ncbi:MAG: carboxymuconolactone decarboxylase family protein [Phyllobacterium sp.]|uniref:carboxymuconolactone decarboxylase family protein n=1 Tax=Phyllobacterium sp. TaxID=1871046 RepID=UPI0030F02DBD